MRHVSCELGATVDRTAELVLAIAPHASYQLTESLDVRLDGRRVEVVERQDPYGTRRHCFTAPPGELTVSYAATITGGGSSPLTSDDDLTFLRPSRYCDSDRLLRVAQSLAPEDAPAAEVIEHLRQWTLTSIQYSPGATDHLDGATEVYLSRRGVCRDTAHLITALARALSIPARVAAVYAPGLMPMDFHAVCEVLLDGKWLVADGTGLAPRPSMIRIATGRDAADTAFLDSIRGHIDLTSIQVDARIDGGLPYDDGFMPVVLA